MKKHTCDALGVCQQHAECHLPCSGPPGPKRFPFAPGVIDPGPSTRPHSLLADLVHAVLLVAVAGVLGFAWGYLHVGAGL